MIFENPAEATRLQVEFAIKEWRDKRVERLAAEKVAAKIKESEEFFKGFLLEAFKQQRLEGMIIDGRSTGLAVKSQAVVSDKEALIAHIKETGELDLLQFRLATGAVDERVQEGYSVPGTEYIDI